MAVLYEGKHAQTALIARLDQRQAILHGFRPHCVPVDKLLQCIRGRQDTEEQYKG